MTINVNSDLQIYQRVTFFHGLLRTEIYVPYYILLYKIFNLHKNLISYKLCDFKQINNSILRKTYSLLSWSTFVWTFQLILCFQDWISKQKTNKCKIVLQSYWKNSYLNNIKRLFYLEWFYSTALLKEFYSLPKSFLLISGALSTLCDRFQEKNKTKFSAIQKRW